MTRISVFIVVLTAFLGCSRAQYQSSCTTPDHRRGVCTYLRACPMLNLCARQPTTSANAVEFLRRSKCGTENNGSPLVCCETIYKPSSTSTISNPCYPEILPRMSDSKFPKICGEAESAVRIFGGSNSLPTEFPWVAVLEYDGVGGPKSICGGFLISDRYVMTAAHCVTPLDDMTLKSVRFGEYNKTQDPDCFTTVDCMPPVISIPIEKTHVYENWDGIKNRTDDIAILKLASPVTFSTTVQPICLPGTSDSPKLFTVAGWGETENSFSSDIKLKVTIPLVSSEQCSHFFRNYTNVHLDERQMCAGDTGLDSCRGDSGGPLMAVATDINGIKRWTAFGIVSNGPAWCGAPESPGIYTKISAYTNWIIKKMD